MKFDLQNDDHILPSMSYDELKERAVEVLSGTKQQILQKDVSTSDDRVWVNVTALKNLGTIAYPKIWRQTS